MLVMVSNNSKGIVHHLATKYPGSIGHLYSPGGWSNPVPWLPFALDNGAFVAFKNKTEWDADKFLTMCDKTLSAPTPPRWVLVPDVVCDRVATIERWCEWSEKLRRFKWPMAFAVQDGMTPDDVPKSAEVVFVGGSTEWKRSTIHRWVGSFRRVHVGRINTIDWLIYCERMGVESVDGTGWYHHKQMDQLVRWLKGHTRTQCEMEGLQ